MIDHTLPKNWKDLQHKVAEILTEIGYKTEIEKDIETARGTVNVDVFSVDESQSPNIVYLCECKHWEKRIPRTVVLSFRTVVQDFGANFGIIISKRGFQKGAYEATRKTNVKLVDWFGFQNVFVEKWFPAVSLKVYDELEALVDYTEPLITNFIARKFEQLGEDKDKINRFRKIREKYMHIGFLILHLKFGQLYEDVAQKLKFPLALKVPAKEKNEFDTIELYSLRDYINGLMTCGKRGLQELDELFNSDK